MDDHEIFMERCLQLAEMGAGSVSPNPMVGSVLVHNSKIIGEGYHEKYGEAHAEVNCLEKVSEENLHRIPESTLYVSLEPCSHYGKTPPCTNLILAKKIKRVVIGCRDPFTQADGKGVTLLRANGVQVEENVLEAKAKRLNKRFFAFHKHRRPYIILKWAQSSNGIIGSKRERLLISNEYSQRLVHKWRSEEAAILVGRQTVIDDDPQLTNRRWTGSNPLRLIIDPTGSLDEKSKILRDGHPTIIFNTERMEQNAHVLYIALPPNRILPGIISYLHEQNIQSLLVEGGRKTLKSFIDAGLWDEARVITNTSMLTEGDISAPQLIDFRFLKELYVQNDRIAWYEKE